MGASERTTCITGVGQSEVGRRLGRDPLELTLDACLAAVDHAGLELADIDGLSTYPGTMTQPLGFSGASAYEVIDALRMKVGWYDSGLETSGQLGSVIKAAMAVAAGFCNHVLCFRSVWEGSAQGEQGRAAVMQGGGVGGSFKAHGFMQWAPPPAPSAAVWIAMFRAGAFTATARSKEQMAWIALNARRNARSTARAIYRTPMTLDDMASRIVTTPFSTHDCDVPAGAPPRSSCRGSTGRGASAIDRPASSRWGPPCAVGRRGTSTKT
jgi:acetyl-CoA acetyltransferase